MVLAIVVAGCAPRPSVRPEPSGAVPTLYAAQRQIAAYIDSGRYAAEVDRVVGDAITWLEKAALRAHHPAIVLDIDETALSNWTAYRLNQWARIFDGDCNLEHGPCGIRAWQALGRATALVPTRRLVDRARELGVAVFFLSGRPQSLLAVTEQNLRDQGFTWNAVILLPDEARFMRAADFKVPERRRLTEEGYTILLTIGDQQGDLDGGFAERTFKLPNPVYLQP